MKIIRRIWSGIIWALAGVTWAVLVQVIGQTAFGWPIDYLVWIIAGFASVGFIIGAAVGDRFLFKGDWWHFN
jgi:ABC-type branched-subunit amino acid transport system permease subunit